MPKHPDIRVALRWLWLVRQPVPGPLSPFRSLGRSVCPAQLVSLTRSPMSPVALMTERIPCPPDLVHDYPLSGPTAPQRAACRKLAGSPGGHGCRRWKLGLAAWVVIKLWIVSGIVVKKRAVHLQCEPLGIIA